MPNPVETGIIKSLKEARQVLAHHYREQKKEGVSTQPYMWVSLSEPTTLIVVIDTVKTTSGGIDLISQRPYEYMITDNVDEVRELIGTPFRPREPKPEAAPKEEKQPPKKPLRQLHAFGGPGQ